MKALDVEQRVAGLVGPLLDERGLELVDVDFTVEHGRHVLRIYIDRPGGVTLGDCTDISRELSTLLDVEDFIPGSYTLEVSSPGLDRPLKSERDFSRHIGGKVRIRTKEPVGARGRRNFKAVIKDVKDGAVTVTDSNGTDWEIDISNIERARLEIVL